MVRRCDFGCTTGTKHVETGSKWTAENDKGLCEVITFKPGHTFTGSDPGDAGTYTGGGATITMHWTAGFVGFKFVGTYSSVRYLGHTNPGLRGDNSSAELVNRVVSTCHD